MASHSSVLCGVNIYIKYIKPIIATKAYKAYKVSKASNGVACSDSVPGPIGCSRGFVGFVRLCTAPKTVQSQYRRGFGYFVRFIPPGFACAYD